MISSLMTRAKTSAPLFLILATLGWGGNTIASRLAVGEISPMMLIFIRWAMVVGLVVALYGKQMVKAWPVLKPRLIWIALMGGFGMSCFNALFYIAAHSTTAVNLGIIQSTMPGLILFGSFLIFGTRINYRQCIGLVVAFIGVVIVVTKGDWAQLIGLSLNIGDLLMLTACLFYSGYTLGLRNRPKVDSMVMMGYFAVTAWLFTIPMVAIEHVTYGTLMPGFKGWMVLLYIAIMPSFLSQVFFMKGVDLIGPGAAGLYANLVPIFSAIMAVLILNESFQIFHLVALTFVFAGIYMFEVKK